MSVIFGYFAGICDRAKIVYDWIFSNFNRRVRFNVLNIKIFKTQDFDVNNKKYIKISARAGKTCKDMMSHSNTFSKRIFTLLGYSNFQTILRKCAIAIKFVMWCNK